VKRLLRQVGLLAAYVVGGAVLYVALTRLTWLIVRP
jgi:hypothetical protein